MADLVAQRKAILRKYHPGAVPTTRRAYVHPIEAAKVAAIPKQYWGISSERYGEVSLAGEQLRTPEQIRAATPTPAVKKPTSTPSPVAPGAVSPLFEQPYARIQREARITPAPPVQREVVRKEAPPTFTERISRAMPEWHDEPVTYTGRMMETPMTKWLREKIIKPVYMDIKAEPVKAAAIFGVSAALPFTPIVRVAAKIPRIAKVIKYALPTAYVGLKGLEVAVAPPEERLPTIRKAITTEILPAVAGVKAGIAIKGITTEVVAPYTVARYRALKYTGKWKIPFEELKPTFKWAKETARGDIYFTEEGVPKGEQLKLYYEKTKLPSVYETEQAKWIEPVISKAPPMEKPSEYLGKWLPKPRIETIRIERKFIKPAEIQLEFEPPKYVKGLYISPKLAPPEVVFPKKPTLKFIRMFREKKATAKLVPPKTILEDYGEYWTRIKPFVTPEIKLKPMIVPAEVIYPKVAIGAIHGLLFKLKPRVKVIPEVITKQKIKVISKVITIPKVKTVTEQKKRQKQITRQRQKTVQLLKPIAVLERPVPTRTRLKVPIPKPPKPPKPPRVRPPPLLWPDIEFKPGRRVRYRPRHFKAPPGVYKPSLVGMEMEKFITKAPRFTAAIGIRLPVRRKKKKRRGLLLAI